MSTRFSLSDLLILCGLRAWGECKLPSSKNKNHIGDRAWKNGTSLNVANTFIDQVRLVCPVQLTFSP